MEATEKRSKTCCFSGHRELPAEKVQQLAAEIEKAVRKLITKHGVCYFGVGGAIGFDTLVAKVLFRMRKSEFPQIKVILVYPLDGYTRWWTREQKREYRMLLPKYDKVVCVVDQGGKEAYLLRNRHLVEGSSYCIYYCTRKEGGTAYTVSYAKARGLHMVGLHV